MQFFSCHRLDGFCMNLFEFWNIHCGMDGNVLRVSRDRFDFAAAVLWTSNMGQVVSLSSHLKSMHCHWGLVVDYGYPNEFSTRDRCVSDFEIERLRSVNLRSIEDLQMQYRLRDRYALSVGLKSLSHPRLLCAQCTNAQKEHFRAELEETATVWRLMNMWWVLPITFDLLHDVRWIVPLVYGQSCTTINEPDPEPRRNLEERRSQWSSALNLVDLFHSFQTTDSVLVSFLILRGEWDTCFLSSAFYLPIFASPAMGGSIPLSVSVQFAVHQLCM
jgi:hypothetical protein